MVPTRIMAICLPSWLPAELQATAASKVFLATSGSPLGEIRGAGVLGGGGRVGGVLGVMLLVLDKAPVAHFFVGCLVVYADYHTESSNLCVYLSRYMCVRVLYECTSACVFV